MRMSVKMKVVVIFLAVAAIFHFSFGLWRVFHPKPGIRELGWTNPSAPGAAMIILGLFCGVVFFVAMYESRRDWRVSGGRASESKKPRAKR